ncbi:hypothetical protein [Clostridium estertheticum]|uniref:hypothetical protein n=1 Tax=Clostridium estertheticum TaxID=238834 RepID=UPI001C7DE3F7|nr:hypothetical protein [Clostridium estertheticum]MBX4271463.1 hypothetical protein [Clostridium estertheticum]WLC81016.1 hypothetical protein KTC98_07270 [Clostridium estertheticum]
MSNEDWFDIAARLTNSNNQDTGKDVTISSEIPDFGIQLLDESQNVIPDFSTEIVEKGMGTKAEFFYLHADSPKDDKDKD